VASGLLYNVDVAIGVFLADAIDTFEKYVSVYRDQDRELAAYIGEKYKFLGLGEDDVYELAYLAAIPEEKIDEVPDSSLRYLLAVDQEVGVSTLETHLNYIEGKPFMPIAISYKRVLITKLYDFVREKLRSINKEVVLKVPDALMQELDSAVTKVMQRRFITVSPQTSLKSALDKVEARKGDLIIVKDEFGNILGVVNPADFLVFLKGRIV
jgi:predicted transcriptional regulator